MANRNYPKTLTATTAIPFDNPISAIPPKTITGATTFTKVTTNAQVGYGAIIRVTANGTNEPDLSAFKKIGSGSWDNTNGVVNQLWFIYDGVDYCVSITQPVAISGGGGGLTQLSTPTLTITGVTDTTISMSWTNVANESWYQIDYSTDNATWSLLSSPPADTTTETATGLTAGTLYYFRIKAVGDGVTYSDSNYGTDNDSTTGGGSIDTDATAFITRLTTAGGTLSSPHQDALHAFIIGLKADGVYAAVHEMWPFLGATGASHALGFKNVSDLTFSGLFTHDSGGSNPDASSSYANTGVNASTALTNNDVSIGFYSQDANTSAESYMIAAQASGVGQLSIQNAAGLTYCGAGTAGSLNTTLAKDGFTVATRVSSTDLRLFRNGTQAAIDNVANAGSLPNLNLFLFKLNLDGGAYVASPVNKCSFGFCGAGLTPTQVADFNTRLETLQDALGRGVQ